ncbi:MAG: DUF1592 domain-containing protein [Myxococcota bacterium]
MSKTKRVGAAFLLGRPAQLALCLAALSGCKGEIEAPDNGSVAGRPGDTGSGGSISGVGGNGASGSGVGSNGSVPDTTAVTCAASQGALNAGLTKLRRLTRDQFNNTVRDLLKASGTPADALAPDERMGPFASNAVAPITELLVQQHQEVAASLASAAKARMSELSPCDLTGDSGTTCANQFVKDFGLRAFRRPLSNEEVSDYVGLYSLGKQGTGGAQNGFRLVVEAMLQSPFFLYHHDVGASGTPQAKPVSVTPYELASRLSYFLWNSMPDSELFKVAGDGSLAQNSIISSQVERMLKDPKAGATISLFHRQWLALEDLPTRDKDPKAFPSYNDSLTNAMLSETSMFSDYVVRQGDGLLKTLLTSNMAFPQGALFSVYGLSQPAGYQVGTPVMLPSGQRAGLLTQAAFLARNAHRDQSSPVHRGIVVRENLLCQPIPPPPANVNNAPPQVSTATSTRERFAQHSLDMNCSGCHQLMDPIGLGFEHYDAIGAYREKEGVGDVDATGQVVGAAGALGAPFDGALELATKLAEAPEVSECVTKQWFRFSLGRVESNNDACSLQTIRDAFRASGGNVRSLIAQIALSDAFRNVRSTEN